MALGHKAEAIASAARARELDPASMVTGSNFAWFYYLDHRYEEAIRLARGTLGLYALNADTNPLAAQMGSYGSQETLLFSAWKLGDRETALGAARGILKILHMPRQADQLSDLNDFWRGREPRIRELVLAGSLDPYMQAKNAMALGERDRALDLLTRQCAPEGMWLPVAAVEPAFDDLHADPRWTQVLDCLKLPADAPARRPDRAALRSAAKGPAGSPPPAGPG